MRRSILAAAFFISACSSSGTTTPNNNGTTYNTATGTMTANVDGTAWTANFLTQATFSNGTLSITGESFDGNVATLRVITMAAVNVPGAGTYTLSPGGDGHGGNALMTVGSTVWSSAATGGTGTLTVSTLNATHMVGTFSFSGIASGVSVSNVTSGTFDIPR